MPIHYFYFVGIESESPHIQERLYIRKIHHFAEWYVTGLGERLGGTRPDRGIQNTFIEPVPDGILGAPTSVKQAAQPFAQRRNLGLTNRSMTESDGSIG